MERLSFYAHRVYANRHELLIEYGIDEPLFLVIDGTAAFKLYNKPCLDAAESMHSGRRAEENRKIDELIAQMIEEGGRTEDLLTDNHWLEKVLRSRFQLARGTKEGKSLYQ
ncbi:MAG: hypothetical protein AAF206_04500, partial [Bacteroidota bacterium]